MLIALAAEVGHTLPAEERKVALDPGSDSSLAEFTELLTVLLAIVPLVPGLRSLPRLIPIHKLVWKDYYKKR